LCAARASHDLVCGYAPANDLPWRGSACEAFTTLVEVDDGAPDALIGSVSLMSTVPGGAMGRCVCERKRLFCYFNRGGNLANQVDSGFGDLFNDIYQQPIINSFIAKLRWRFGE
jgi:hypothetical protein